MSRQVEGCNIYNDCFGHISEESIYRIKGASRSCEIQRDGVEQLREVRLADVAHATPLTDDESHKRQNHGGFDE
ncbi:hypothetical protein DSO57_1034883 [Entomophthora muscae]|uniref:Uncharacterized protein n=1 Tax=Entomophthora muscae TaxID=34485 RepID=A0ACC2RQV6_9FUNG|nr:hypothetical protein DSO57_1034883 [Entomophthora muscae]